MVTAAHWSEKRVRNLLNLLRRPTKHLSLERRLADAKALWAELRALGKASPPPPPPPQRPSFLRLRETRQMRLGLEPDIDRKDWKRLATRVLFGEPLQDHEREFVARLVDPDIVTLLIGGEPKKKGRPASTEAAIKRDEIAEAYFFWKAMHPRTKHKEKLRPDVAKLHGVSESSVDKALHKTDPVRRREMKAAATAFAEGLEEVRRLDRLGLMNDTLATAYADQAYAKAGFLPSYDTIAKRAGARLPRSMKRAITKAHGALK
jgi:hypothetical protein